MEGYHYLMKSIHTLCMVRAAKIRMHRAAYLLPTRLNRLDRPHVRYRVVPHGPRSPERSIDRHTLGGHWIVF